MRLYGIFNVHLAAAFYASNFTDSGKNNDLIGFTETKVENLLGVNDNDVSPFVEANCYVYCLGMKGQFLKGDYYYLVIEFENGVVTETSQKQG